MQKVLATAVVFVVVLALVAIAWLRRGPALAEPAGERPAPAAMSEPMTPPITAPAAPASRAAQAPDPEPPAGAPGALAAPAIPAADGSATLAVFVTDGARSVLQGTVELLHGDGKPLASLPLSPADGSATFEGLAPGKVVLRVSDLDAELLPPRMQAKRDRKGVEVELVPGPNEVTLELERRAAVFGYLRDVDGSLAQESTVRFSNRNAWERYVPPVDLRTSDGYYEGHLYPGHWFSQVMAAKADPDLRQSHRVASARPALGFHELAPGSVTQIDFQSVSGSSTLLGRVLDDERKPFERLPVLVERYEPLRDPTTDEWVNPRRDVCGLMTDDDGRFSVEGLLPGLYRVVVESGSYHPMGRPEERRVGEVAQPKQVEVKDATTAEVEFHLRRFRPTHFRAQIDVDPAWARKHYLLGRVPGAVVVLEPNERRLKEERVNLYSRENKLDFYLDLEGGSAYVELSLGVETKVHPLFADGSEPGPFVIDFP